jgi:hypothetical protein
MIAKAAAFFCDLAHLFSHEEFEQMNQPAEARFSSA